MKKVLSIILLFNIASGLLFAQKPEIVSIKSDGDSIMLFTITTQSYGGNFAPKHCLAIWITDSNDIFKRTLKLAASTYKVHLVKWNQMSSGNVTDAITGATLNQHTTHSVVWNGKDKNGNLLPDGNYKVYIEFTEVNAAQPSIPDGPWFSFNFTKGLNQTQMPSDVYYTYNNQNKLVFKNISLQSFGTTSIKEIFGKDGNISVFPNPSSDNVQIRIKLDRPQKLNVSIYSMDGKKVKQYKESFFESGEHIFLWSPKDENLNVGTYFVKIASGFDFITYKLLIF